MSSVAAEPRVEVDLDPSELYFVSSAEDDTVLLGLDAKLHGGMAEWFDTYRDRMKPVVSLSRQGPVVTVVSEGARYRFEPLTKALYDAHVKSKVELSPDFASTEELRRFYLANFLGRAE
ncbi:MAG: hypothetical protein U1E65_24925 [Myxococcota bacterium]